LFVMATPTTPLTRTASMTTPTRLDHSTIAFRTTSASILEGNLDDSFGWHPQIPVVTYRLPTVAEPRVPSSAFKSISPEALRDLVDLLNEQEFNAQFVLIDCRYPYEYEGGHVKNAINVHDTTAITGLFFPQDEVESAKMHARMPIFYCEFSQVRGPKMAYELRRTDRMRNVYPHVEYSEIYVLDRGYSTYFRTFQDVDLALCYVPMTCKKYSAHLKKYTSHYSRQALAKKPRLSRIGRPLSRPKQSPCKLDMLPEMMAMSPTSPPPRVLEF